MSTHLAKLLDEKIARISELEERKLRLICMRSSQAGWGLGTIEGIRGLTKDPEILRQLDQLERVLRMTESEYVAAGEDILKFLGIQL